MRATLLTLLPSKQLEAVVTSAEKKLRSSQVEEGKSTFVNSRGKRDALDGDDDGEDESRPLKRLKGESGGREQSDASRLKKRQDEEVGEKKDDPNEETQVTTLQMKSLRKPWVRRRVFIWDLDETLVLFASLYTGTFAQTHGKEVAPGIALGEEMMTFLLTMLERHFFFSDLHDADVDHITRVASSTCLKLNNASTPQSVRMQAKYDRIREIYERRGHVDFLHDTSSEWFTIRGSLVAAIDNFSTGWLNEARQVLELIAESAAGSTRSTSCPDTTVTDGRNEQVENVNVLVTNTQLVPALCKCLVYQLDSFFPIDCVYSSAKVHKHQCFETILEKYDAPDVEFIAIGDGLEEERVSRSLGLEFHKIQSLMDLKRLRYDLQLVRVNSSSVTPSAAVVDSSGVAVAQMSVATSSVGQTAAV